MPDFFRKHRFFQRITLIWACVIITVVVLRVTEPDVISAIGGGGATIVTGIIGILATVIAFYQHRPDK